MPGQAAGRSSLLALPSRKRAGRVILEFIVWIESLFDALVYRAAYHTRCLLRNHVLEIDVIRQFNVYEPVLTVDIGPGHRKHHCGCAADFAVDLLLSVTVTSLQSWAKIYQVKGSTSGKISEYILNVVRAQHYSIAVGKQNAPATHKNPQVGDGPPASITELECFFIYRISTWLASAADAARASSSWIPSARDATSLACSESLLAFCDSFHDRPATMRAPIAASPTSASRAPFQRVLRALTTERNAEFGGLVVGGVVAVLPDRLVGSRCVTPPFWRPSGWTMCSTTS